MPAHTLSKESQLVADLANRRKTADAKARRLIRNAKADDARLTLLAIIDATTERKANGQPDFGWHHANRVRETIIKALEDK